MTDPDDEDLNDEYDSPWKEALEHYLPEFMAFYFPDACAKIDWSNEPVFLDQELRAIVQDAELGRRFVDKLVGVTLQGGDEGWVYIHIEVQGTRQAEFAERMFVYNYRLYDRYRRPVASMAVLADEHSNWRPDCFGFEVLGCKHNLMFPIAKLSDYQVDELLKLDNAFALITAAHVLTQQTRKQHQKRFEAKLRLVRILYQRCWDKQRVIDLFAVMDWMMKLPAGLDQQLWREIEAIEENDKMQYITSVERMGIAKGRVEGLLEGRNEGRLEGESKLLRKQLERRFGSLPAWALGRLHSAAEAEMECWAEAVLTAPTLESIFDTQH